MKGKTNGKTFTSEYQPERKRQPDKLTPILKELLFCEQNGITPADAIISKLIELALEGNLKAIQLIFDRIDGKPKETIESTHSGLPKVIYLPADTGVQPYLNEADVIDPTEN